MLSKSKLNFFKPIRRNFYAATLRDISPIPSHIVETDGTIKLEISATHTLMHARYKYVENKYHRSDIIPTIVELTDYQLKPINWGSCLSITADGQLETTYFHRKRELLTPYDYQFYFSTDYYTELNKPSKFNYTVGKNEYLQRVINWKPDLLFAVPQTIWDEFILRLPDQVTVKKLNLSTHRHLYQSYNQIASDPNNEQRVKKAELVGRYHFLKNYDLTFPPLDNFDFSEMPSQFLNIFAHCPDPRTLQIIYMLLKPRFTSSDGKINIQRRDDFIATLPSSVKFPLEFINMLDKAQMIFSNAGYNDLCYKYHNADEASFTLIGSKLLYELKNQFNKSSEIDLTKENCRNLQDYVDQITKDLIYPELIRKLSHSGIYVREQQLNDDIVSTLRANLLAVLIDKNKLTVVNALQERWHRNITVINAAKPPVLVDELQWHALFAPQQIGEVSFSCLISERQLRDEGNEMHHCVGGYVNKCLDGSSHIIKVCSRSGNNSTLQLAFSLDHNGCKQVEIVQNRTKFNNKPCDLILNATDLLLARIRDKSIKINQQRGEILNRALVSKKFKNQYYPYDFLDQELQETIYKAYIDTKTLPSYMIAKSYKDLVETKEINSLILNVISQLELSENNIHKIKGLPDYCSRICSLNNDSTNNVLSFLF